MATCQASALRKHVALRYVLFFGVLPPGSFAAHMPLRCVRPLQTQAAAALVVFACPWSWCVACVALRWVPCANFDKKCTIWRRPARTGVGLPAMPLLRVGLPAMPLLRALHMAANGIFEEDSGHLEKKNVCGAMSCLNRPGAQPVASAVERLFLEPFLRRNAGPLDGEWL